MLAPSAGLSPHYGNLKTDKPHPVSAQLPLRLLVRRLKKSCCPVSLQRQAGSAAGGGRPLCGAPLQLREHKLLGRGRPRRRCLRPTQQGKIVMLSRFACSPSWTPANLKSTALSPFQYGGGSFENGTAVAGNWERTISIYRSTYSSVVQARGWLPDAAGGTVWWGPHAAHATCCERAHLHKLRRCVVLAQPLTNQPGVAQTRRCRSGWRNCRTGTPSATSLSRTTALCGRSATRKTSRRFASGR